MLLLLPNLQMGGSPVVANLPDYIYRMNPISGHLDKVCNNITVLVNDFTAGSILFSDGTNAAVDSDNLFWDDSNDRLGIGDTTPSASLSVNGGTGSLSTGIALGDGDTGFYEASDDIVAVDIGGSYRWGFDVSAFGGKSVVGSGTLLNTTGAAIASHCFNGDTNTGMGRALADTLTLITGGTERLRIDSSGDIGIGGSVGLGVVPTAQLHTSAGRIVGTTRITGATTLGVSHHHVFANTDGSAYTVTLPAGVEGTEYRIVNSGSSANDLTIAPDGSEDLIGANSNQTLADGESLTLVYNATDGWY